MNRHTIAVRDKQWERGRTITGQRNPAEFLRDRLQDGLDAYEAERASVAVQEIPAFSVTQTHDRSLIPDPGYQHDYWTVVIGQSTQCNGCRGPLEAGQTIIAQHYAYASGYKAKHYFGMACCMKIMEALS